LGGQPAVDHDCARTRDGTYVPHQSAAIGGTPLDRIVAAVGPWEAVPGDRGRARTARRRRRKNLRRVAVERARLARTLVDQAPRDEASP
jgi:hypothetical protein